MNERWQRFAQKLEALGIDADELRGIIQEVALERANRCLAEVPIAEWPYRRTCGAPRLDSWCVTINGVDGALNLCAAHSALAELGSGNERLRAAHLADLDGGLRP